MNQTSRHHSCKNNKATNENLNQENIFYPTEADIHAVVELSIMDAQVQLKIEVGKKGQQRGTSESLDRGVMGTSLASF